MNIPNILRKDQKGNVINSSLPDYNKDRYCSHCYVQLVRNPSNTIADRNIFICPKCGVRSAISDTRPGETLVTTFPAYNDTKANSKLVIQKEDDIIPRSEYFIRKRRKVSKEQTDGANDPYMRTLQNRNDIQITDVAYYDAEQD